MRTMFYTIFAAASVSLAAHAADNRTFSHETAIFKGADEGDFLRSVCNAARFGAFGGAMPPPTVSDDELASSDHLTKKYARCVLALEHVSNPAVDLPKAREACEAVDMSGEINRCTQKIDGVSSRSRVSVALEVCEKQGRTPKFKRDCLVHAYALMQDVGFQKPSNPAAYKTSNAPNTWILGDQLKRCTGADAPANSETQATCLEMGLHNLPVIPPGFVDPRKPAAGVSGRQGDRGDKGVRGGRTSR